MPIEDASGLLSMLWTPLVVVTASHEEERGAQIAVSAFAASIVPEKPRVMVEIQKRNHTHALIDESRRFAINILPKEHWPWVRRFGFLSQSDVDRFAPAIPPDDAGGTDLDDGAAPRWRFDTHDLPLLEDAIGWLSCRVVNSMDGGDMTVFLAVVDEAERLSDAAPAPWSEVRPLLSDDWVAEYGRKISQDIPDSARRMESIDYTPFQLRD
jgi:flavin reductase (DIM6/NTAB) family NADH-FMN oxidoreductase RutF